MNIVRLVDGWWFLDSIYRVCGYSSLFWKDPWVDTTTLCVRFRRLYDLSQYKLTTVDEMYSLGWGLSGEVRRWRGRLFAWEGKLVGECVELLSLVVLQVSVEDRWIWKIHFLPIVILWVELIIFWQWWIVIIILRIVQLCG